MQHAHSDDEGKGRADVWSFQFSRLASEIPLECEKTAKSTTKLPSAMNEVMSKPRKVAVAQPGTTLFVNIRMPTTTSARVMPSANIAENAVSARAAMRSMN